MPSQASKIKRKLKKALKKTGSVAKATAKVARKLDNEEAIHNMIMKVGEKVGERIGSRNAGRFVANQITRVPHYLGYGDYHINNNSLMKTGFGPMQEGRSLKFFSQGRATRIQEREFVANVYGTTDFTNVIYPVTPSNPTTFPWLSLLADKYDQWEPHGIVFEFRTMASDYAATVSLGTVIMSMDYDATDPTYADKIEAENSDYSVSTKPSCSAVAGIECSMAERPTKVLYTGSIPSGRDPNLFSLGNFQVSTQGLPNDTSLVGELWVSYDISFFKKQIIAASRTANYSFQAVTGQSQTKPFGTSSVPNYYWEDGLSLTFGVNDSYFYLPNVPGTFMIDIFITGTVVASFDVNASNCTITQSHTSGSSTGGYTKSFVVNYKGDSNYIIDPPTLILSTTATTVTEVIVTVKQVLQGQVFT